MDALKQDLRFGLRLPARTPGVLVTAVLALALGIGANSAVFSIVYNVLLKPLPYPEPDRVVAIYDTQPALKTAPASYPKSIDWRDQNRVFDAVGGSVPSTSVLTGAGDHERIRTSRTTASLFRVFAVPRYGDDDNVRAFYRDALERIAASPGVVSVGATSGLPLYNYGTNGDFDIEGKTLWKPSEAPLAEMRAVAADYFRTPGVPLVRGRLFTPRDDERARPVAVINRVMAERFWPNEDPIGKRIKIWSGEGHEIVGVVGSVRTCNPARPAMIEVSFLIAYAVSQQTREFGIRMAMGADATAVPCLVLGRGLKLALAGTALGAVAAIAATRLLRSMLFNVAPTDPLVFGAACAAMVLAASAACLVPARAAARVDPVVTLKA